MLWEIVEKSFVQITRNFKCFSGRLEATKKGRESAGEQNKKHKTKFMRIIFILNVVKKGNICRFCHRKKKKRQKLDEFCKIGKSFKKLWLILWRNLKESFKFSEAFSRAFLKHEKDWKFENLKLLQSFLILTSTKFLLKFRTSFLSTEIFKRLKSLRVWIFKAF